MKIRLINHRTGSVYSHIRFIPVLPPVKYAKYALEVKTVTATMVSANQFDDEVLDRMMANTGQSLEELAQNRPVLLVFLRHFGCTFCREALSDLAQQRGFFDEEGIELVLMHMASNETAERYFSRYGLSGVKHISDPECEYYSLFGLTKGSFTQLFGLQSWIRGFSAGVVAGHGVGTQLGDGFQMPGVFVIQEGKILNSFIHKLASDRPDYLDMVKCCRADSI